MENKSKQLIFHYDGELLHNHKMPIESVIDSLQGSCELLKETHLLINGTSDDLEISVYPFNEGSFEYILDVIQNSQDHLDVLAITGLATTAGAASIVSIMKQVAGRKIHRLSLNSNGDCLVHIDNEQQPIIAPSYFKDLLSSKSINKAVSKIAYNPLSKEGIDSLTISESLKSGIVKVQEISKEDSASFKASRNPVTEKRERTNKFEDVAISFLTVHADKTTGWRINSHDYDTVPVSITDEDFIQRVRNGSELRLFSDSYNIDLVETINLDTDKKSYTITQVYPS